MVSIVLWKDRENRIIDAKLFSDTAEDLAKDLAGDQKKNKGTQVRKFYDEVVRLNLSAKSRPDDWEHILPLVNMIVAKAAYANGRKLVSDDFLSFIRTSIGQVSAPEDLAVFTNFFEAFCGFYKLCRPKD